MKTQSKTSGLSKNTKVRYVSSVHDGILEEVRIAMWKKARYMHSMDIETQEKKNEKIKIFTLVGNEIDKFIEKLK